MIEPTKFILFIGVSWALILAPGPDMFYVITRGMAHGRRAIFAVSHKRNNPVDRSDAVRGISGATGEAVWTDGVEGFV